ncbi:MAG: hypothetical protein GEV07_29705 [Streptosporangiales bacterium]|nr:hypothetical protein [Streptosporangiales bacterium]
MSRRLRRDTIVVVVALGIPLLLVNPPIIGWVSDYAASNPITLGQPTIWLWLELWYAVMLVELVLFAVKLPSWQAHTLEHQVEEVTDRDRQEG